MSRIFISHSSKDDDFAQQLAYSLGKHGIATWIDSREIRAGVNWSTEVNEGLKSCNIMLLIISPPSMATKHVTDEWQWFESKGKTIIPIQWQAADLHYQLEMKHRVDFSLVDFDIGFAKLLHELTYHGFVLTEANALQINSNKAGNIFWLCHDLMELYRWLVQTISAEWINIGFRQCYHHAKEVGLPGPILSRLKNIQDRAANVSEWTNSTRDAFADEVRVLFNEVAQQIQASDPNFDSGPG